MNDRIDVIVPAYRAHETLGRTLGSLAMQSIAGDLDVTVIDDVCPEGDYHDLVVPFSSRLNLKLVRLSRRHGDTQRNTITCATGVIIVRPMRAWRKN